MNQSNENFLFTFPSDSLHFLIFLRLWYQLSEALLQYIENPSLKKGDSLIKLYEGFAKEFETKFDQAKFIQIANAASDQFPGSILKS